MATVLTVSEFKTWQRVDGTDDDAAAGIALAAAESFIAQATGKVLATEKAADSAAWALLNAAVLSLAGHWFENREASSMLAVNKVPFGIQSIIAQLAPEV